MVYPIEKFLFLWNYFGRAIWHLKWDISGMWCLKKIFKSFIVVQQTLPNERISWFWKKFGKFHSWKCGIKMQIRRSQWSKTFFYFFEFLPIWNSAAAVFFSFKVHFTKFKNLFSTTCVCSHVVKLIRKNTQIILIGQSYLRWFGKFWFYCVILSFYNYYCESFLSAFEVYWIIVFFFKRIQILWKIESRLCFYATTSKCAYVILANICSFFLENMQSFETLLFNRAVCVHLLLSAIVNINS